MGRNKQLIILAGIFGLLLIYVLATQTGDKGFNTVVLPELTPIAADQLSKIMISQGGVTQLAFEKQDDQWFITKPINFPVEKNKINNFTRALDELRLTDKISEQPERLADFGLNTPTAYFITLSNQEGKNQSIYLGSTNQANTHTFAALPDDPAVYQVIGNFDQHLATSPEEWRSLAIFDFNRDDVQSFSIEQKGSKPLQVNKTEVVKEDIVAGSPQEVTPTSLPSKMVWQAEGAREPLSDPKVNQFLNTFVRLRASGIIDKGKLPSRPLATILVKTLDHSYQLTVIKYDQAKKEYLVAGPQEGVWYTLADYQGKSILKNLSDFQP